MSGQELMDDGSGLPSDPEQLQAVIEEVEAKVISLQGSIAEEEAKMEGYRVGFLGDDSLRVQGLT